MTGRRVSDLLHLRVEVETKGGQLKHGTAGNFTVLCDEGPHLGGSGSAPPPLHYFLLSAGFWLLTQVSRCAEALGVEVEIAKAEVKGYFTRSGSIVERTEQHRTSGLEVNLEIVSEADGETIEELAWLAEDMCYVMQAIKNPVEAKLSLTVNGQAAGQP